MDKLHPAPPHSSMPTTASLAPAIPAGEERHDDAAEGHDAAYDCLENAAYAADDGHDAAAYGGESRPDLNTLVSRGPRSISGCIMSGTYAGEYAAHCEQVVVFKELRFVS